MKRHNAASMGRLRRLHFIGIGGAGMNGIAQVMLNLKYQISGSDIKANNATALLAKAGATIYIGHQASQVKDADVVIISTAVKEDNPEVIAARKNRIPVVPRAEMLAEIMRFMYGIAMAGTHGKTTTTSLVASILNQAGLDPTFVIGGVLKSAGVHARLGTGEYLVAEADESDASFLHLLPMMAVVTNIDADHMATYHNSFEKLKETFIEFLHNLPFYGIAILCLDDDNIKQILPQISRQIVTYGTDSSADIYATDIQYNEMKSCFTVVGNPESFDFDPFKVQLNMPGKHNILNALAAIAVSLELNIKIQNIQTALQTFEGIGRRFQLTQHSLRNGNQISMVDDYAHHPKELAATIQAVRSGWPNRRLVLAFQPHRYSRTQEQFDDFVQVLSTVDVLLLSEVYSAGENFIEGADGRSLTSAIRMRGQITPIFVDPITDLPQIIKPLLQNNDILLISGAGDIGQIPALMAHQLAEQGELRLNEPMEKHCSWRTGGKAKRFYRPSSKTDLISFLQQLDPKEAILWLGLGSNLLIRDKGFNGVVITLKGRINHIEVDHNTLLIEAGASCAKATRVAARSGLIGLEFLAGVPGTIGGALAMNAGGFGGETWALVKEVTIMNRQGQTRIAYPRDFKISYRSALGLAKDEFFISALFELTAGDVKAAQKKIKTLLELRSETQPIGEATCGSVFKNPENMFAAKLIEDTGLKGLRQGDAMVSIKHANFIVNQGSAKATDIEYLINKIQQRILEKKGILLEPEVKIVGDIQ